MLKDIFPDEKGLVMSDDTFKAQTLPISIKIGDVNLDGFPDLLVVTYDQKGHKRARLLRSELGSIENTRCFLKATDSGLKTLDDITDVRVASFIDIDEDVRQVSIPFPMEGIQTNTF